jgi:EpsI family protein
VNRILRWAPAGILGLGALFTVGVSTQRPMALRMPLDSVIPMRIDSFLGHAAPLSQGEIQVAGVTSYLYRTYARPKDATAPPWSLYVGYYDSQTQGKTIHSPKNCLPGSGWEALQSSTAVVHVGDHTYTVNRYLLRNGAEQALVLYWYQGRGRVAWNEYKVKWDLLRDAALHQRTEEALVRVVIPVTSDASTALEVAQEAAREVIPDLTRALPSW